jgi:hypothetical protein
VVCKETARLSKVMGASGKSNVKQYFKRNRSYLVTFCPIFQYRVI